MHGTAELTTNNEHFACFHLPGQYSSVHGYNWSITENETWKSVHRADDGRYAKPTKKIPIARTTSAAVSTIFVDHLISSVGIPATIPTDNGPRSTSKFFQLMCAKLCIMPLTTTEYHLRANRPVERYNLTIFSQLRYYVADFQQDWASY